MDDSAAAFSAFSALFGMRTEFGTSEMTSFGIQSIDKHDEHTPSEIEYSALKQNPTFKRLAERIGGFSNVHLVKCGNKDMQYNLRYVQEFLASGEGQKYRRESGWCLLVGAPTGCLFLPFFWCVEKEKPYRWMSISGFPDEKMMMLCTSRDHHKQFAKIEERVFKAVAWFPVNIRDKHIDSQIQQSVGDFEETGVFGSVSEVEFRI